MAIPAHTKSTQTTRSAITPRTPLPFYRWEIREGEGGFPKSHSRCLLGSCRFNQMLSWGSVHCLKPCPCLPSIVPCSLSSGALFPSAQYWPSFQFTGTLDWFLSLQCPLQTVANPRTLPGPQQPWAPAQRVSGDQISLSCPYSPDGPTPWEI